MPRVSSIASLLLCLSSTAFAADVIVSGHVQRVILQPSGTENCPPPCETSLPRVDGIQTVCVSNDGGCQTLEIEVDHVYGGQAGEGRRQFKTRIGEWGPTFSAIGQQIVVSQVSESVSWSPVTLREGRVFVDPKRLRNLAGARAVNDGELVALDELIARGSVAR